MLISIGQVSVRSLLLAALLGIAACGGSSGGGSGAPDPTPAPAPSPSPPPPPEPEPTPPPLTGLEAASRMASRATFGLPFEDIETLDAQGQEAWLEQQFSLPVNWHRSVEEELLARLAAGDFDALENVDNIRFAFWRLAWWHRSMTAQDQLRQRVAFALSEIFVVSDKVDLLVQTPYALSDYYDLLLQHSFGNFRDLLRDVTLHPSMGVYLSHINNAKADPENNTYPDENYAREVMQLFSIGLFELKPDGSEKLDDQGLPIPTYDNDDIREFAKVFTGLALGGDNQRFGARAPVSTEPMKMFDAFHEPGEKQLLRGEVLPAGQTGMEDIEGAIDNLFYHPNVGPFIGRQMIQRLVTSNPSPEYVARVSAAFNGDDGGERGDMRALLRAILLDPEAQAVPEPEGSEGKLREPLLRVLALLRQLQASSADGFFANAGYFIEGQLLQHPLASPSVFNFFLPAHQPSGEIAELGLVAPEFQITNSNTVVAISNMAELPLFAGFVNDLAVPPFQAATLDLDDYIALAEDPDALLQRLDLVMTYGTMSDGTYSAIVDAIALVDDLELRTRVALYLVFSSPDYAVAL